MFKLFIVIETPIYIIDFEGSHQSGIVEYGVVTLLGDSIIETHTRICAPIGTISDRDHTQHGISEEIASKEVSFDADWPLFADWRMKGPFCAHNASVEDNFLRSVWAYPRSSPNFSREGESIAAWGPWLDTLYLYRRLYPQLSGFSISDLTTAFGLQDELNGLAKIYCPPKRRRYHCALYDAFASALLLRRLYSEPDFDRISLHWLFLQSASTSTERDSIGQLNLF